jgi:predicted nucleic-acid-binding Zn-ribbon protein
MNKRDSCEKCGGTNVEAGFISGTQNFAFVPFPRKWFSRRFVKVDARLCKDCGAVGFVADPNSLASYLEKSS